MKRLFIFQNISPVSQDWELYLDQGNGQSELIAKLELDPGNRSKQIAINDESVEKLTLSVCPKGSFYSPCTAFKKQGGNLTLDTVNSSEFTFKVSNEQCSITCQAKPREYAKERITHMH